MTKQELLKTHFGYDTFREGQEAVIDALLAGKDVLAVMPTGAGKSICYQVPALMMKGITLVISPLISLMKDQVRSLNQVGISAAYLNSSLTQGQYFTALRYAKAGRYPIIYVAPERLTTEAFLDFALSADISMIAVDESHCVSQWGQDFRPSYLKIAEFVAQLPKRPVIGAFTATATKEVREDIKTGDILTGNTRVKTQGEKFSALLYVSTINGLRPAEAMKRKNFEDLTPIFPNQRIRLENPGCTTAMRIVDLVSPIGKGQRGMIVSPPKAGKTTLLKEVALSVQKTEPNMHLLILLIDERPEEVTDIREAIEGPNVEVIHSTFDELPEHHKRVSEMVISRAKRLVEHGKDVMILLDSITRLSRAYNLIVPPSGRTLSGGLDPAALYSPKRFFGAARNMREGGSLTILATALVDTGSKMDDVVYEEFKGTGNMELMLDRKLQEKRVFPAIDIPKSGTRREDLLLTKEEQDAVYIMRKAMNGMKSEEAVDNLLNMFSRTKTNEELVQQIIRQKFI